MIPVDVLARELRKNERTVRTWFKRNPALGIRTPGNRIMVYGSRVLAARPELAADS